MLHKRRRMVSSHEEKRMHRITRLAGGVLGLVLILAVRPSWGGHANNDVSDALGNTAGGSNALANDTTGTRNTAWGFNALFSNTTGNNNTATGVEALQSNIDGDFNTATGVRALFSNTTGDNNTA